MMHSFCVFIAVLVIYHGIECDAFLINHKFTSKFQKGFSSQFHNVLKSSKVNTETSKLVDESLDKLRIAKEFVSSRFGIVNFDLLDDSFEVVSSSFVTVPKPNYLASLPKVQSSFLRAVPDIELRPYNFIIDESNPDLVWFKLRPKGTFSGPLSYKGEVYLPNNKIVEFPIIQSSVVVKSGKVTMFDLSTPLINRIFLCQVFKFTSDYVVDRLIGNTDGLTSFDGLLASIGEAPSKFSYLPALVVIKQFFSRTRKVSEFYCCRIICNHTEISLCFIYSFVAYS